MRKAISGVLVIAMMMSTFGASNVQAASINSGSNYVEDNGVIVEASVTDADDIEDAEDDTQEVTTEERNQTKGNLDSLTVEDNNYEYLDGYDEISDPVVEIVSETEECSEDRKSADRIHYINLNDGTPSHTSDAIVIESNGHYGLIDASNRDGETDGRITNYDGGKKTFDAGPTASGTAVLKYLAALGVNHLDFVLVTHSHSDHLGGVPEIVKQVGGMNITNSSESIYNVTESYKDNEGKTITQDEIIDAIKGHEDKQPESTETSDGVYLVDKETTYIYKGYTKNSVEGNYQNEGWLWANEAYFDAAYNAMVDATRLRVDTRNADGMTNLGATFAANGSDSIDDTISFKFGDFNISLYNLYSQSNTDENANSIVTYIEKVGGSKTVLLADMDLYNNLENRIANAVVSQHGKVNVMKVAHHGNTITQTPASTSKALIDTLGAQNAIICTSNVQVSGYTPFYGYMRQKNMGIYRTMDSSGNAIVQDMTSGLSIKNSAINNGTNVQVYKKTKVYTVTTETTKCYGKPAASQDQDPTINAKKILTEKKDVTEIETVIRDTYLSFPSAASQWSQKGQNDWSKWYKDATNYDWVFVNGDGSLKKGWNTINGYTYYFNNDGIMQMGWTTKGGKRAYLYPSKTGNSPQGSLATGWNQISGQWYYFDANGKGHEGWMQNNADWYYIDNGLMYTGGLRNISGVNYFFGSDGKMKSGWQKSGGNNYYFDSNGKAHSGWLQSNNKWYYTESSGKMVTSQWIDNYWIGSNGVWSYQYKGSWKSNSKGWWYEDASGWYPKSCWQKINGEYYYFGSDGYMAANEWIDGKWINGSGYSGRYKYTGSWKSNSKGWWFTDTSGWYPVNKWQKINGKWYYFEGDGYMASNKYIGGYWVNSSGAWE